MTDHAIAERTDFAERIRAWLAPRAGEMEALLEELVNIDSNSFDKAGTDAVGEHIAKLLTAEGIAVTRIPKAEFGDVFRAEVPGHGQNQHVLMLGHRDTVFAKGTVKTRGYSRQGDMAFGPGVCDMKGGLVANIFALRAIKAVGGLPFPVVALFTSDEEIGSPTGQAEIEAAARGARAVFNTEPGRVSGNVVTGRKGGASFHITVKGRAAHSGVNHKEGASATYDILAIVRFEAARAVENRQPVDRDPLRNCIVTGTRDIAGLVVLAVARDVDHKSCCRDRQG